MRVADQLSAAARAVIEQSKTQAQTVNVSDDARENFRHQAEIVRAKYPSVNVPKELRKYVEGAAVSQSVDHT